MDRRDTSDNKQATASYYHHEDGAEGWPELERVHIPATPEQVLAKEIVRKQAENAAKRLVSRSRLLMAVVVLALLAGVQNIIVFIPPLIKGSISAIAFLGLLSIVVQLASASYLLRAKDPDTATQVLKLLLLFNAITLTLGFASFSLLPLVVINLVLLAVAQAKMASLKYGAE